MKKIAKSTRVHIVAMAALILGNLPGSLVYGDEFQDRRQSKPAPQSGPAAARSAEPQRRDQPVQRSEQRPVQVQPQRQPVQRREMPAQRIEQPQRRDAFLQRRDEAVQRRDQGVQQRQRGSWQQDTRADRMRPAERMRPETIRSTEWVDRREGRYRSPAWQIDTRFRHNRYYPRYGTVMTTLPPNYYDVPYRGERFYFQNGIWFRSTGAFFSVTIPPAGVIVPVLPPDYAVVPVGAVPYYYANGVYYTTARTAPGYVVVNPPAGIETVTVQESGSDNFFDEPMVVVSSETTFVYPNGTLTESQMQTDRNECSNWADGQTGYNAATTPPDTQVFAHYQIVVKACMEGRGYIAQ
jgi:hypothetical protein